MYTKIMVPIDLAHLNRLEKALTTAADLARHYNAALYYVGVATAAPNQVAHTPAEFAEKLAQFGSAQAKRYGIETATHVCISHDPSVDLDATLIKAIEAVEADLVVMASHVPGLADHLFASNAGYVAAYAKVSVFVIR